MNYILYLNDMRAPQVELLTHICCGSEDELHAFLERESVDYYHDGQWGKSYRKDGPLEWYNQPLSFGLTAIRLAPRPMTHVSELK